MGMLVCCLGWQLMLWDTAGKLTASLFGLLHIIYGMQLNHRNRLQLNITLELVLDSSANMHYDVKQHHS